MDGGNGHGSLLPICMDTTHIIMNAQVLYLFISDKHKQSFVTCCVISGIFKRLKQQAVQYVAEGELKSN